MSRKSKKVRRDKGEVRKKAPAAPSDSSHFSLPNSQFLVPRLRFPEFRDAPAWECHLLRDLENENVLELGRGNVISKVDIRDKPGDYPIYSSSVKNNGQMGSYGEYMFEEDLISWSVDGGGNFFHRPKHKFSLTNVCGYMRIKTDQLEYRFLAAQLQQLHASLRFDYQVKAHPSVIRQLYRLGIPRPAEQRKIAACLGSLDDLIAAEGRKLAALRQHKKGLMQQLFPREGETRPRIRFPEFRNAPEWEDHSTKKVCDRIMDGTHFSPQSKDGPRPYLTSKNIRDGHLDLSTATYISEEDHREIYARCPVQKDDVLLTKDGASTGNCAMNVLDYEFSLLSSVAVLRAKPAIVLPAFLYYTICSPRYRKQLFESISGQAITRITLMKLEKYLVALPSLAEQKRIADCLSAFDAMITAQVEKLDALRTHKRGLMQQLFPSPEDTEV